MENRIFKCVLVVALAGLIIDRIIFKPVNRSSETRHEVTKIIKSDGVHYQKQTDYNSKSDFTKSDFDKLQRSLDLSLSQIKNVTEINGRLSDTLKSYSLKFDSLIVFTKRDSFGSFTNVTYNTKDTSVIVDADVVLRVTDFTKRQGFFKPDVLITDVFSPSQNVTVLGLKTYRKETAIPKKRIGLGLQIGYSTDLKPYLGVGLSYSFLRF